jgi:hypothetical protein
MRISRLLIASAAIGAALAAGADPAAEAGTPSSTAVAASDISWGSFDDPSFDPGRSAFRDVPVGHTVNGHVVTLGVVAIDSEGNRGRIHTVVDGDTLWDISEVYLGTPWVWPSIWRENGEIANPHLIVPDDRIWISSTEMRRLTKAEADAYLANEVPERPIPASEVVAIAEPPDEIATLTPASAAGGSLSLAAARADAESTETGRNLRVPFREDFGFVSDAMLEAVHGINDEDGAGDLLPQFGQPIDAYIEGWPSVRIVVVFPGIGSVFVLIRTMHRQVSCLFRRQMRVGFASSRSLRSLPSRS